MKFNKNILKTILAVNLLVFSLGAENVYADSLELEDKAEITEIEAKEELVGNEEELVESKDDSVEVSEESLEYNEETKIENENYLAPSTADNPQELTRNQKVVDQINQLQLAVEDVVNVVNTNAYYNYASQDLKAEYEAAIKNAKAVLARKDSASYEELRSAMARINTAKQNINKQVNQQVNKNEQKAKLQEAIKRNKTTLAAAKQLKSLMPNSAKKFERQLNGLMAKSEALIARSQAILAKM